MKRRFLLFVTGILLFFMGIAPQLYAQYTDNQYGLKVIRDYEAYHYMILVDSSNQLLNVKQFIPDIALDIKYSTPDNFIGEAVYDLPLAFARKPVVEALKKVEADLKKQGLGLKVWDAYRPYSVTEIFYQKKPDTVFVSAPWKGSRHNRGCAIDLTLIDLKTGKELKMPTRFDDFTKRASPTYEPLPKDEKSNRDLLITTMEKYGFRVYSSEWWHFDYNGWEKYDLMDIPFNQLVK
jgi:zinc D-Ala-D-Ala dipeptidase